MRVITVTQSGSGVTGGRRTQVIVSRTGPQGPAGGGAGSVALDDLTDVSLVGTTSGDFLRYNGTAWTDTKIVASDLGTGTADTYHFLAGDLTWQDAVPLDVSAKNTTASTIAKGTPVYITGSVGSGHTVEVAPADASSSGTMSSIGLTVTELAAGATGYVRTMGVLEGVSTGAYSINQTLFVAAGGGLTNTRPTGTTTLVQNIGRVMRANNNNGTVLILGPGRVNDVPNRIGTTYLASGTAGASNYLRGDQTWSTITATDVGAAPTSRNLTASTGLSGGGDLSADRSFSVLYGTTAGTAAAGNDARLSDARTPLAHKTSHQSGGSDELALAASQITSGTMATARLGSGTADATTFLRGDQTYAVPAGRATVVGGQGAGSQVNEPSVATSLLTSTVTIPVCAAGDVLLFSAGINFTQNSSVSRSVTFAVKLGATTILSSIPSITSSATARVMHLQGAIRVGSTTAQSASMILSFSTSASGSTGVVNAATGTATENLASASTLDLLVTATNNTTQNYTLSYLNVTKVAA